MRTAPVAILFLVGLASAERLVENSDVAAAASDTTLMQNTVQTGCLDHFGTYTNGADGSMINLIVGENVLPHQRVVLHGVRAQFSRTKTVSEVQIWMANDGADYRTAGTDETKWSQIATSQNVVSTEDAYTDLGMDLNFHLKPGARHGFYIYVSDSSTIVRYEDLDYTPGALETDIYKTDGRGILAFQGGVGNVNRFFGFMVDVRRPGIELCYEVIDAPASTIDINQHTSEELAALEAVMVARFETQQQALALLSLQVDNLYSLLAPAPEVTFSPTNSPTPAPTFSPTPIATSSPTREPTSAPTLAPTLHSGFVKLTKGCTYYDRGETADQLDLCSPIDEENGAVRCCTTGNTSLCMSYNFCDYRAVNFTTAFSLCDDAGMRLCTKSELNGVSDDRGLCCNTGCQFDKERIWTSDSCDP